MEIFQTNEGSIPLVASPLLDRSLVDFICGNSKGLMVQVLRQGTTAAPGPGTPGCRGGRNAIFFFF